ncbi:pyrroline-5-carboxylate reductase, partial [Acinetobacter baumannii]|nr:pyrroline-5-carboxylate reductase [Acinetobacter baumannii]
QKLIRIMPNTPAKIGLGVIAVSYGENVNDNEKILCRELLTNLGKTFEGSESDLNVIGAICGSGPAFVFRFMESLCNE